MKKKEQRQTEATVRQAAHDKRTAREQIAVLDRAGKRALKERTKLVARIAKGE